MSSSSEADRLESLWSGDFGDAYVERNQAAGGERAAFWKRHFERFPADRVLEVGCNVGANLRHIAPVVGAENVWGVDVNQRSLETLHASLPTVGGGWARARELPFRDGWFDLVFTVAVLIHQPASTLPLAVSELVRCSRRYVSIIEYTSDDTVEVDYRGERAAFFKRDYEAIVGELFPELRLVASEPVTKADGFDDGLGWFVWQKPA